MTKKTFLSLTLVLSIAAIGAFSFTSNASARGGNNGQRGENINYQRGGNYGGHMMGYGNRGGYGGYHMNYQDMPYYNYDEMPHNYYNNMPHRGWRR